MNRMTVWLAVLGAGVLNGCQTFTPDDEPGPNKTMAYYVRVESSTPGATIETNNVVAGQAPLTIKIFGDKDGNFHYFGNPEFVVRAVPPNTNEFVQTKVFRTGGPSSSGDRVPGVIFFDLGQRDGAVLIDSFPTR